MSGSWFGSQNQLPQSVSVCQTVRPGAATFNLVHQAQAVPLHAGKGNEPPGVRIEKNGERVTGKFRLVERAEHDRVVHALLLKERTEVVADEGQILDRGPVAGRVVGERAGFVLHRHRLHGQAFLPVGLDELEKVERIGPVDLRVVEKVARVEGLVVLHPGRRGPGRRPQTEFRLNGHRLFDVGNQSDPVALDGEMLHLVIERGLIQGVAVERVVVRADGHAADGKSEAVNRIEDPAA